MTETTAGASQPDTELINRALDLTPVLRASAPESEVSRRLSDGDIAVLSDAQLFELCVPKRLGGLQVNVRTLVDVIAAVAYGNGAAGWVVSLINTSAWMAALFPEQAQQDVWGSEPGERIATVFDAAGTAVPVDGGYRVSGRWGFGSGSLHAGWASLGMLIPKADAPNADNTGFDVALALVPASMYTIDDTWFTAGMRGTGSNTIVAQDAFVPFHRIHLFDDLVESRYRTEHTNEPLYRAPFLPVGTVILGAPQLGLARAALDLTLEVLPRRSVKYSTYTRSADAPIVQLAVAEAASMIDAAELLLHRCTTEIDELAAAGQPATRLQRARARMDTGHAIRLCRSAIDKLLTVNGASAFAEFNPIQRMWRDSATASRHAFAEPEIGTEIYGKELLGVPNVMPI
jgi:3-hydroxy-9,10-secoandrosta-1,3,5(10)-triene-9,17-dione monooxygenase